MKFLKTILLFVIIASCSSDDIALNTTLSHYMDNRSIDKGAVIACAASDINTEEVLVFYYPEVGAFDVRLYVTEDATIDSSDYSKYNLLSTNALPVFNGYLEKRAVLLENEKWIIVTLELDNDIKISNPIRIKQKSKGTVWNDDVNIDQTIPETPKFKWTDNPFGDNAIYFQVVTNAENDLLSGTYTFENEFQYYNTSNVVLNITIETPPVLISNQSYNFTLMDVSLDNWVNHVAQKNFNKQ